jgi:hypothetical protein
MSYINKLIHLLCIICLPFSLKAQTYHNVTNTSGSVVITGITVTVDTVTSGSNGIFCGVSPYIVQMGGFKFKFSVPIYRVRCHIVAVNTDDTVRIYINGVHYTVTMANLQTYANGCYNGPMGIQLISGNIVGTTASTNVGQQFDVYMPSGIDSISLEQKSSGSGWVTDFAFAGLCPGNISPSPLSDTVCVGDTLHLAAVGQLLSSSVTYGWSGPGFTSSQLDTVRGNFNINAQGTYTISAYDTGGCVYSSSVYISAKTAPSPVSISGVTTICPGDSVKLSAISSIPNLQYSWSGPATFSGTDSIANPMLFAAIDTGYYYVTVSNNCGSILDSIQINDLQPASPQIIYTNPTCSGQPLSIAASTTTSNVTFLWTGPGFNSTSQNNVINSASVSNNGYYVVKMTHSSCVVYDSVYINVIKTPSAPQLSSNSPVCAGDTLKLFSTDTSSNITYAWTGSSFNSALQNPYILNSVVSNSGNYVLNVSRNGCTSSANITVLVSPLKNPPTVAITVSPSDTICLQDSVYFTATSTLSGSPTYKWWLNNVWVSGNSSPYFSSNNLHNFDQIGATVISSLSCQPIDTGNSNVFTMIVSYVAPPVVTLNEHTTGLTKTFSAVITGSTVGLTYKWEKNGVTIPGQNATTYSSNSLLPTDTICLVVKSSIQCTVPDTVKTCYALDAGLNSIYNPNSNLSLYPNPVQNELHITGTQVGSKILVTDMVGRELFQTTAQQDETILSMQSLSKGSYIIQVLYEGSRQVFKISK